MAFMRLALPKRVQQNVPMRAPRFDSLDEEFQRILAVIATEKNMSPQEFIDYLHNPHRARPSMKALINSLDSSQMGTCTLEEFLEIMDESRICN